MTQKREDYITWDEYFMAVARLAGLPPKVVARARKLLKEALGNETDL